MTASTTWDKTAADKRAARDALIPKEWLVQVADDVVDVMDIPAKSGVLSAAELEITESDAATLIKKMVAKELTSEAVTVAFCKRAAIAQQLTNCLTEIFFEQAIADAKKIDDAYAQTGKPAGPLHGLPVSLKDNFNVKGYDTTVGFIAWCNEAAKIDSELTKLLREQGAVLYCKTNVPTAMMIAESYNNVWDYTCSPWNRNTSSGGSSGGEGALLAFKGSPLGVGTDIGGSIRIPCALSGIYGLKPSFGRFPTYGARSGMPGQEAVRSINGPMSASLEACNLFSKTVVDSQPWLRDPYCLPIPWREVELPQQLVFGIMMDNGIVRPTPPVTRALLETKKALEAAGHKVIEWTPYNLEQSKSLLERFFVGDGGAKISETIAAGPEPWPKGLATYQAAAEKSKSSPPLVGDLWSLQAERSAYTKGMLDAWNATAELTGTGRPIDGLISPVTAYASCPRYTFAHVTYTSVWNITDQSSAVFPVTRVTEADVAPTDLGEFRNAEEKAVWDSYDPKVVLGAPVGLQLVTRRLEEEKALALAGVAAKALAK
jgi:amidase